MKKFKIIFLLFPFLCAQNHADGQKFLPLNESGKFKIVQFTDLHYNPQRDTEKAIMKMIKETLAAEKPDLAVFTGDVVTCEPVFGGWNEVADVMEAAKTPWAFVFGNHDDEYDKTRKEIMEYVMKKKYCLSIPGPENIKGTGNYTIEIRKGDSVKFVLYCMDSNSYATVEGAGRYGWFGFDQVDWYRGRSREYTAKNGGTAIPSLAFFHIPLIEYGEMTKRKFSGMKNENECPGGINTGMYAAMLENGDVMGTFVGHDHDNDYIGLHYGVALAYGRFSGSDKTTYSHMMPGARIIELTGGENDFKTWIRLKDNYVISKTGRNDLMSKK